MCHYPKVENGFDNLFFKESGLGSLVGQDAYIAASNDCADITEEDNRFWYIDDLEIADLVSLAGILYEYDVWSLVFCMNTTFGHWS